MSFFNTFVGKPVLIQQKNTQPKTKILLFWASRGVEPGTSRTLSENHATRPTGHPYQFGEFLFDLI